MSDLPDSDCYRSLLESLVTENSLSTSPSLKDTIKWYAYTPFDPNMPSQFRDTQRQGRVLAIRDAVRVASIPLTDYFVK